MSRGLTDSYGPILTDPISLQDYVLDPYNRVKIETTMGHDDHNHYYPPSHGGHFVYSHFSPGVHFFSSLYLGHFGQNWGKSPKCGPPGVSIIIFSIRLAMMKISCSHDFLNNMHYGGSVNVRKSTRHVLSR